MKGKQVAGRVLQVVAFQGKFQDDYTYFPACVQTSTVAGCTYSCNVAQPV